MAYAAGTARIQHADTGQVFEIDAAELDWDAVDGDDREMGPEIFHTATVNHPDLGDLTWLVVEYPIGAENMRETDPGRHTIVQDLSYGLNPVRSAPREVDLDRADELIEWFFARFEDPANSLPHVTAEGGFQWIDGGPYDAAEVLYDNFSDEEEAVIESAVRQIEAGGITDWAMQRSAYDELGGGPDDDQEDDEDEQDSPGTGEAGQDVTSLIEELIAQIPPQDAGLRFGPTNRDLIGVVSDAADAADIHGFGGYVDEAVVSATELCTALAGTNAHQQLRDKAEAYLAIVQLPRLVIPRLFAAGVRLENVRAQISLAVASGEGPDLPAVAQASLSSLLELHAAIIGGCAEGRGVIENVLFYSQSTVQSRELQQRGQELSVALADSRGLLDEEAQIVIDGVNADAGNGPRPDRSTGLAVSTTNNVLKAIFTRAASVLKYIGLEAFAATVVGGATIHATAIGMEHAMQLAGQGASAAYGFVSQHIDLIRSYAAVAGSELAWVQHVLDWLRARRR